MSRLSARFADHGIRFGYAVDSLTEPRASIIEEDARVITTEGALKLARFRPLRAQWDWDKADQLYNFSKQINCKFHGHTPIWHQDNPVWFETLPNNKVRYEFMKSLTAICSRYPGMHSLDVVNEALLYGSLLGKYAEAAQSEGYDYVANAYEKIASENTNVIRTYNSMFLTQAERNYALSLVQQGLVQAVGYECHWNAGDQWLLERDGNWIDAIINNGAKFYFSEIGVRGGSENERAATWIALADFAVKHNARRFVVWGVKDGSETYRNDTTLHFNDGTKKPEYYRLRNFLETL